jgi:isochorismate hydrolase
LRRNKRRRDNLWAYSPYILEDGSMVDCKVKVLEYDFKRGEFLVEFVDRYLMSDQITYYFSKDQDINKAHRLRKYCGRSNLQMEYESAHEAAARKAMVARRRQEAQNQLN